MKFKSYVILLILFYSTIISAQDGSLDNTFSDDGIAITPIGDSDDIGYSVAVQSDGKIVVVGASQDSTGQFDFAVVRYNDNGTLDNSFASDGKTTTDIKGGGATDYGNSIAIQPDNKIVVAGWTFGYNAPYDDYAVVRYNANGTLDNTFGSSGIVTTNIGNTDKGQAVVIQNDGKIVVAGYTYSGDTYDFSVVRYDTNGVLDNTFNSNGKVITDIASDRDYGMGLAIQHDNKIIVVGAAKDNLENKLAIVRYNIDGSLDTSFDSDGKVTTSIGIGLTGNSASVIVQPDNKIAVACTYWGNNGEYMKIAVVRYNSDGSLDNDWNSNGITFTSISEYDDEAYSIKLQNDGKILVGGYSSSSLGHDFALIRYNDNGTLDSNFDTDGIVTTHLTTEWGYDDAFGMALKSDKIILCGRSDNGDNYDFAVTQYNNDGTVQVKSLVTQNMQFGLFQNYPNPFNPSTTIQFALPKAGMVNLKVYNILGEEVATLINKEMKAGLQSIKFDASRLSSGLYFYKISAGTSTSSATEFVYVKKMLLLK